MGGSAVVMPWLDEVPATLVVWYPGMEGGAALGDVLTGAREPGGRLPFALPVDDGDLVDFDPDADAVVYDLFHGQWKLDRDGVARPPAVRRRAGLHDAGGRPEAVVLDRDGPGATAGSVEVAVANTGARDGSTVVFLFAGLPGSSVERPVRRLVGFRRVAVGAGGRTTSPSRSTWPRWPSGATGPGSRSRDGTSLDVGTDAGTAVASVEVDVAGRGEPPGGRRARGAA